MFVTMKFNLFVTIAVLCVVKLSQAAEIVCYYDSSSYFRDGEGKFQVKDLETVANTCQYLIYGYAGIDGDSNKIVSLNPTIDLVDGADNYRSVTHLKNTHTNLKVLLSVGGRADTDYDKYLTLLESSESRHAFIKSVVQFLTSNNFDGLDLAWQFPEIKPHKVRDVFSSLWHAAKKQLLNSKDIDSKVDQHRDDFSALVLALKQELEKSNLLLTLTVNPNVNSSAYYDIGSIVHHVKHVHLSPFDCNTPARNPVEADYTAPLYEVPDRHRQCDGNHLVEHWLKNGAPAHKIYYGVPTFARTWKMTRDSDDSGIPPVSVDGPGEQGIYTAQPGVLSYQEICEKVKSTNGLYTQIRTSENNYGVYAFRLPNNKHDVHGLWAGYDDPNTISNKVSYVKTKGLGGIAINDLSMDDFKGLCSGNKYPLLNAAKNAL